MDKEYSWKRTQEAETDLADLLRALCMQWKRIAACGLVSAVLFGGYGFLKSRGSPETDLSVSSEEVMLTEAEEQAVSDALRLESEIRGLETYLEGSMLMQADPYHKCRYVMLYCIEQAKRKDLQAIAESYLNFVLNGGAADALAKTDDSTDQDQSFLAELMTAYQKTYSSPYQFAVNSQAESSQLTETLFYVEVTGRNEEETQKLFKEMQSVLEKYADEIKKTAGNHRLRLVNSMESITADSGLLSQQREKKSQLSSNKTSLRTMTDAFTREQMAVYKEAAGSYSKDPDQIQKTDAEHMAEENFEEPGKTDAGSAIRFMIFGLLAGIFIYCGIYTCGYLFSDTVKSTSEIKRMYTFPFFGVISEPGMNVTAKNSIWKTDLAACGQTQVVNRIRLACHKHGITKLCAAADYPLDDSERESLKRMAEQLKDWGITMTAVENACTDVGSWDILSQTGHILYVCRIGRTTHRMIDETMSFCQENGVMAAGAAAFYRMNKTGTFL